MKALSVRQPWAWLIVHGEKTVENRTWPTSYRGPLAIHASKTLDMESINEMREFSRANHGPLTEAQLAELEITGAVIGIVDVVDCTQHPRDRTDREWHNPGAWAWVLRNPHALDPQPAKGKLGLFDITL